MPKQINVRLLKIVCKRNASGGSIELNGSTFGATFQNNPDDPNDEKERKDLFSFPAGPIRLSEGEQVPIHMENFPAFMLSANPPDNLPRFLKITGELNNGLGSNFLNISNTDGIAQEGDEPIPRDIEFNTSDLDVILTIGLSGIVW